MPFVLYSKCTEAVPRLDALMTYYIVLQLIFVRLFYAFAL